jgi:mannosyl-glycoprotein endo-beta-N-acetylglucosaminidase
MSIKEIATICSPIKNLNDLFDISLSCLTNRFKSSPLIQRYTSPRQKILLCHDMKGGYLEDKYVILKYNFNEDKFNSRHTQGCQINQPCYRFFRWHLIDIFVYFSHELVTIPPLVWIDCAHKNGVQILGL